MKLTNSIYMVASGALGFSFTHPIDCNVFLIDTGEGCMVIDSGTGLDTYKMDEVIRSHGFEMTDIKKLIVTHYHADHACGAAHIAKESGCQVYAPVKEADAIETGDETVTNTASAKVDGMLPSDFSYPKCPNVIRVSDGESVSLGNVTLTMHTVSGHSLEGIVAYGKIDGKMCMFTGDVVFAAGQVFVQAHKDVNLYMYAEGMKKLAKLKVDSLFPAHGVFSFEDGGSHIRAAAAKFDAGLLPSTLFFLA